MPKRELRVMVCAEVGDRVLVKNYRRRPPVWEIGKVEYVDASIDKKRIHVSYTVMLDRRTDNGPIRLYVGSDSIKGE